jgi:hypothetical protein
MVDSGAIDSYVSLETVERIRLCTREKKEPYELALVDGKAKRDNDGMVTKETLVFIMTISEHTERAKLDVTQLGNHEIILGMPWIKKHNPIIDWVKGTISFDRCECRTPQCHGEACATSCECLGYSEETKPKLTTIPEQYKEFQELFGKELSRVLPKHKPWDHAIPL